MHKKKEFIHIIKKNEGLIYKISKVYANDIEDQKALGIEFKEITI